ncbi:MarR family winged helix-turn-helix transcriptional regulator [Halomonas sp. MS1]|nr:MarR family winged helix-turn-helix transcriptional regulator [Halomonas sp. MS1]UTD54946.1 MarR family winged helix-turn-helix transcriptional regulator [Halomonas sp. MS1]
MNSVFQPSGNEVKAAAFNDHRRSGRLCASQKAVLDTLAAGPMTRNQIAGRAGIALSSACGRCRELLDADLITVMGTTQDKPARQLLQLTDKGRVVAHSEEAGHAKAD